jgi:hypothetical protein
MRIPLTVKFVDGTSHDTEAIFADFIMFEKERKKSVVRFEIDMQLTDLAWLAWTAMKREGKTALKFEPDWIATVEMVSAREEEANVPLGS